MTQSRVGSEKRAMAVWFIVATVISIVFRTYGLRTSAGEFASIGTVAILATIFAKIVFVTFVFRTSRALNQNFWLTLFYCALAPFSVLYIIPFISLIAASPTRPRQEAKTEEADDHVLGNGGRANCPFCAEDIKRSAIICRYCQRDLPRDWSGRQATPIDATAKPAVLVKSKPAATPNDWASLAMRMEKLRAESTKLNQENRAPIRGKPGEEL